MKTVWGIFLFLMSPIALSQTYHFDRVIQYTETSERFTHSRTISIYFNSEDSTHYMVSRTWGAELDTYFFDTENQIVHRYKTYDVTKDTSYEYWYSNTTKLDEDRITKICALKRLEYTEIDPNQSKVVLTTFTTKKKTKVDYQIEILAKPYTLPVFPIIAKALQSHFIFCDNWTTSANKIPFLLKTLTGSRINNEIKLVQDGTIDFHFTVDPKKIILKDK